MACPRKEAEDCFTGVRQNSSDSSEKAPPPPYHTLPKRSISTLLAKRNPALAEKVHQMQLTIAPIVHVVTGIAPRSYPRSMLELFLLTETQLDYFAQYYSQCYPTSLDPSHLYSPSLRHAYPQTMDWSKPFLDANPTLPENCRLTDLERLKVKMRMFSRFIGMRGAETPTWEYERQIEILSNKIERSVREEGSRVGDFGKKGFWGPPERPS